MANYDGAPFNRRRRIATEYTTPQNSDKLWFGIDGLIMPQHNNNIQVDSLTGVIPQMGVQQSDFYKNYTPMGLPSPNATQEEIANDIGSIIPPLMNKSFIIPKPTMPNKRGCGSNEYTVPFKIQGEEKCIDKTIAMVIGAIAIYYIVKK